MTYVLIDPPSAEPLTLAQVKAHLRIEHDDEDDLLAALAMTARQHLERETGLCLLLQRWRLCLDAWPKSVVIPIARGPVQAIERVVVYGDGGLPLDVSLEDHLLDAGGRPARLWLRDPPAPARAINGIEIEFSAGFGEAGSEVPSALTRAMLIHVGFMYGFRGVVPPEQQPAGIPDGYERLIAGFRLRRL